jgi:hypothetical protein
VRRVGRQAFGVAGGKDFVALASLLVRVVALPAQGLPVGTIPEKREVASVRLDVVDNRCRNDNTPGSVIPAQRLACEVLTSCLAPCGTVEVVVLAHMIRACSLA